MKRKIFVNSEKKAKMIMNAMHLEEVNNCKYLGTTASNDGRSTVDFTTRLAMTTPSLTRLFRILRSSEIS